MTIKSRNHVQTMAYAYQEICQGEEPWVALGNFLNAWFEDAKDHRDELVIEPLADVPADEYAQRWAAYCAASIEHLCYKYGVACPQWVQDAKYVLPAPWYCRPQEHVRAWLMAHTPEEFSKRNIYSGDRMFLNKWELAEAYQKRLEPSRGVSTKEQRSSYKPKNMPVR